jgi:L-2-hydroxyglutarate oxidase LhgO
VLESKIKENNTKILLNTEVINILKEGNYWIVYTNK